MVHGLTDSNQVIRQIESESIQQGVYQPPTAVSRRIQEMLGGQVYGLASASESHRGGKDRARTVSVHDPNPMGYNVFSDPAGKKP